MRLAIASDHRGVEAVRALAERLRCEGHDVDLLLDGCDEHPCDYPVPAYKVARAVAEGRAERGILICGTGIGMAIAANKVQGAYAAVVHDELTSQLSRSHNNANILCMSADLLGQRLIEKIVSVWLEIEFEGGRHQRRIDKIKAIERGEDPGCMAC